MEHDINTEDQLLNLVSKLLWLRQREQQAIGTNPDSDKRKHLNRLAVQTEERYKSSLKASTLRDLYFHKTLLMPLENIDRNIGKYVNNEVKSRDEDHAEAASFLRDF